MSFAGPYILVNDETVHVDFQVISDYLTQYKRALLWSRV
jgi:hypothetical protein